jgi:hypothetical protein
MPMRALSATELLKVWERGLTQSPAQRALTLLTAGCLETPLEGINQFNIAQRDMQLLALRERIFGPQLSSIATCPACGQRLEFGFDTADIQASSELDPEETLSVTHAGYDVQFRLPNSLDLATLDPVEDYEANRRRLLQLCVTAAKRSGAEIAAAELPQEVVTAITQRLAEADPDADLQLALRCPQCDHGWQAPLDIVSYFWSEIHSWAVRILREIHTLASAYGWREADVLALSPRRRRSYLEMIEP